MRDIDILTNAYDKCVADSSYPRDTADNAAIALVCIRAYLMFGTDWYYEWKQVRNIVSSSLERL